MVVVAAFSTWMAIYGGHLAADRWWRKGLFWVPGVLCFVATVYLAVRTDRDNTDKNNAIMSSQKELQQQQQKSDQKIDIIFNLLQPSLSATHQKFQPMVKPVAAPNPSDHQGGLPQVNPATTAEASWVRVSRTERVSTRADAPYATELVVQTSKEISPVRMIVQCDQDIVAGQHLNGGAFMMYSVGVAQGNPKAFILRYDFPSFTPSSPIDIELWSRSPSKCDVQMF
jgi:hypothetical protein